MPPNPLNPDLTGTTSDQIMIMIKIYMLYKCSLHIRPTQDIFVAIPAFGLKLLPAPLLRLTIEPGAVITLRCQRFPPKKVLVIMRGRQTTAAEVVVWRDCCNFTLMIHLLRLSFTLPSLNQLLLLNPSLKGGSRIFFILLWVLLDII